MLMMYEEKTGHLPLLNGITLRSLNPMYHIKGKKKNELSKKEQKELFEKLRTDNLIANERSESEENSKEAVTEVKESTQVVN